MVGELQGLSLCLKNPSRKPKPNPKPSTRPRRLQPSIKDQNSGMVWFQCEDCGENLKKPKLPNHFRMCSAYKLSCIDCGLTFNRESVQTHTQCISEAEKYGPKGQAKVANDVQAKPNKPKPNADVDVNVGLSSHPPWQCSLCNTSTTSHQTLQLHADGKKHRAKARAFHAAQKQSNHTEEPSRNEEAVGNGQKVESVNGADNKMQERKLQKHSNREGNESQTRKRKVDSSEDGLKEKSGKGNACDLTNGKVIQAEQSEASKHKLKKKKVADESLNSEEPADKQEPVLKAAQSKIKWRKLVISTLKSSDGVMKMKKLQKLVIRALKESGVTGDEKQLQDELMLKVTSSSRFAIDGKRIRLMAKTEES